MDELKVLVDVRREGLRYFQEDAYCNFANFCVGMHAPSLFEKLSPRPVIAGYDNVRFCHVGEHAPCGFPSSLSAQGTILDVFKLLLGQFHERAVCPLCYFVHFLQDSKGFWIVSEQRRHYDSELLFVHESLAELGEGEVPVSDQFVGAASGHSCEYDGESSMLKNAEVFLLNDVLKVLLVVSFAWVGPGLVAEPTCELAQDLCIPRGVRLPYFPRCSSPLFEGEHGVGRFPDSQVGGFHSETNSTKGRDGR